VGQDAEGFQGIHRYPQHGNGPGQKIIAGRTVAFDHAGESGNDQGNHGQAHQRRQPDAQIVADKKGQNAADRRKNEACPENGVNPGDVFCRVENVSGELGGEDIGEKNKEGGAVVGPPDPVGPEILESHAVDAQLEEHVGEDKKNVVEIGAVLEAEIDEKVVDHHDQQDAVIDAQQRLFHGDYLGQAGRGMQYDGQIQGACRLTAQVQGFLFAGCQHDREDGVFVLDDSVFEGQAVACLKNGEGLRSGGDIQIYLVKQGVFYFEKILHRAGQAVFYGKTSPDR